MLRFACSSFGVFLLGTLATVFALPASGQGASAGNVYVTYHWHLHQPIYWPEQIPGQQGYQRAWDSAQLKLAGTGNRYAGSTYLHPRNHLVQGDGGEYDAVFDKADRINIYQGGGLNSLNTLLSLPNAGASVSYSGALMANIASLGAANQRGYGPNWANGWRSAWDLKTSNGHPRADLVGLTYHHALSPLLPRAVFRRELELFQVACDRYWGAPRRSRGFWPVEGAFGRHLIPTLRELGYQWSIIANSHLARTAPNYVTVASRGSGGWNIDPPNRADQLGPTVPANQWWSGTIDGRGGTFPAPFAYQAHQALYVDPATGQRQTLVVVPMCDVLSYENGYGMMGTGTIDSKIAPFATDAARPLVVLLAHDGDNAWAGGFSYYNESVPQFMQAAQAKGYRPSTIEQILQERPVPPDAIAHVEDGGWVNAANDWGHPQFINWLWPPARNPADGIYSSTNPLSYFDFETPGWAEDFRNWAVLMAGANWVETAEQVWRDQGQPFALAKVEDPDHTGTVNRPANAAELAWHYYLGGLDSGFMYYGTALDDEVKQSLAVNRALTHSRPIVEAAGASADRTPPTVFHPQRFPWNPGGKGWGPLTGYRPVGMDGNPAWPSDFYIWTQAFDVSGLVRVELLTRADADGTNPLADDANETFAGGPGVGPWRRQPMTKRELPRGKVNNDGQIDFFLLPDTMADYYFAKVEGYRDQLVDYYIEAEDARGNLYRSPVQHVFVENSASVWPTSGGGGGGGGGGDPAPGTPGLTFHADGVAEAPGWQVAPSETLPLYVGLRGTKLYLATTSAGGGHARDHFLVLTANPLPSATATAPWAKAGTVAFASTSPFLAAEGGNSYLGWFNLGAATASQAKGSGTTTVMEGEVDLAALFPAGIPDTLYVAAFAYATADGGALLDQNPPGNGNSLVEPAELLAVRLDRLADHDGDGARDFLAEPARFPIALSRPTTDTWRLAWMGRAARRYALETWDEATGWATFAELPASDWRGGPRTHDLPDTPGQPRRLFRLVSRPPE